MSTLWFAEKFVSLLIEQHQDSVVVRYVWRCDLLKNSYLCLLNNTCCASTEAEEEVVICWKIRIFAYWTTPESQRSLGRLSCDLLKNSYLCLLNNTCTLRDHQKTFVVICWKIRIFAYWTTPRCMPSAFAWRLWFAEKFVSLLIEQHRSPGGVWRNHGCDLLKNSYLCLLNNTICSRGCENLQVVICWKIRIFAYWTTPPWSDMNNVC